MLLNNQWKQKQEIKIYLETNEDGNRAFQDLWDTEKTFLRGKCTLINPPQRKKKIPTSQSKKNLK